MSSILGSEEEPSFVPSPRSPNQAFGSNKMRKGSQQRESVEMKGGGEEREMEGNAP